MDRVSDGCRHRLRIGERRQVHEEDTVWESLQEFRADLEREASLSAPTDSGESYEPVQAQLLDQRFDLPLPPDETGALWRQVVSEGSERARGWELGLKICDEQLEQSLGIAEVLEPVQAQIQEARSSGGGHQGHGGLRKEYLSAVTSLSDTSRPVDLVPDVVVVADEHLTGVYSHADTEAGLGRPWVGFDRPLSLQCCCDCVAWAGKGYEESVSFGSDLHSSMLGKSRS